MTNCVMGFAHRFDWEDVRPFVRSLRETARYEGDIVLFTDEGMNAKEILNKYQVQDVPVGNQFADWGTGFMKGRFWAKLKFLEENPRYDYAFLADTRDMIFQKNMDVFFSSLGIHLTKESICIIDDPGFNARGIRQSYGQGILDEIGENPVLNVGSMWGDRESMIKVCKAIKESGSSENCDQHGLNFQVWKNNLPAIIHENGEYIWTIGVMMNHQFEFKDGFVLLDDGSPAIVCHQYDRHQYLRDAVREFYS